MKDKHGNIVSNGSTVRVTVEPEKGRFISFKLRMTKSKLVDEEGFDYAYMFKDDINEDVEIIKEERVGIVS
jgi:hypothetical protein